MRMLESRRRYAVAAIAGLFCALVSSLLPARAEGVADFYRRANLVIIVPFNSGGGIDIYARLLGRHIGKHIPGSPTVMIQNRPGAGGISGINYLFNVAPKDGSQIATMSPPNAVAPLLGSVGAKFDPLTFEWIGNIARDTASCTVAKHVPMKGFADFYEREVTLGATGYDGITAQHVLALKNVLNVKFKLVVGYPGTRDIWVAMERGELDGACAIWSSLAEGPLAQTFGEGKMRPFIQLGTKKLPVFGDAPLVYDLAKSEDDRAILRFIFGQTEATRPFAAPPGVPAERLSALRKAFMATMKDPDFLAEAQKGALIIDPMDADETTATFKSVLLTPKPIVDRAIKAMQQQ